MSCILSIIGANLDVDDFVSQLGIPGFEKQYKGDFLGLSKHRKIERSRAFMEISSSDFNNFNEQVEDTIHFLDNHKEQLKLIILTPGIEDAYIDFGVNSKISEQKLTQRFYFPINMINICAELRIEIVLSTYKEDMQVILERNYQKKKMK